MIDSQSVELRRFGAELRRRRKEANLNLTDLADIVGVKQGYLSQIELATVTEGKNAPTTPSDKVLRAISGELNWPMIEIQYALGRITDDEIDAYKIGSREIQHIRENPALYVGIMSRDDYALAAIDQAEEIARRDGVSLAEAALRVTEVRPREKDSTGV